MNRKTLRLLDLMYPNRCDCCMQSIPYDRAICADCERALQQLEISDTAWAAKQPEQTFPWRRLVTVYAYDGKAKAGVLAMKDGYLGFERWVAERLAERCRQVCAAEQIDAVAFVPGAKRNRLLYGVDHAERLAAALAKQLARPLRRDFLVNTAGQIKQHLLPAADRAIYAERFQAGTGEVQGKTILLVDDVLTTGSTMKRCATVLLDMGAAEVWAATATCRIPDMPMNGG